MESAPTSPFGDAVSSALAAEREKASSLNTRATVVISSSSAVMGLLFALTNITWLELSALPQVTRIGVAVSLATFLGAALVAVVVVRPKRIKRALQPRDLLRYVKEDWGEEEVDDPWNGGKLPVLQYLAIGQSEELVARDEVNQRGFWILLAAFVFQFIGVLGVAVALFGLLVLTG